MSYYFWSFLYLNFLLLQRITAGDTSSGQQQVGGAEIPAPVEGKTPEGNKAVPKQPTSSATCNSTVVFNGVQYRQTLSWALSNVTFFKCASKISTKLKEMFAPGKDSSSIREATQDSVANICPVFLELASKVVMSRPQSGQPSLRSIVCERNTFSTETVEDEHICQTIASKEPVNVAHLETLEYMPKVANVFRTLIDMEEKDCSAKCGAPSKSVLCSAFFSLAQVVATLPLDELVPKPKGPAATPGAQPGAPGAQPGASGAQPGVRGDGSSDTAAHTQSARTKSVQVQSSIDRSAIIGELASPILNLPQNDLDSLITADPRSLEFSLGKVKSLSQEQKEKLLKLDDAGVILRMFWIMKMDPQRLRGLTDDEWTLILNDPKRMFTLTIWFQNPSVKHEIKGFTNLDRVVNYIHRYREILFAARDKLPGETSPDSKLPGKTSPDIKLPGKTAPDIKLPGKTSPDIKLPGKTSPDSKLPGKTSPDIKLPGKTAPGSKLSDEEVPGSKLSNTVPDSVPSPKQDNLAPKESENSLNNVLKPGEITNEGLSLDGTSTEIKDAKQNKEQKDPPTGNKSIPPKDSNIKPPEGRDPQPPPNVQDGIEEWNKHRLEEEEIFETVDDVRQSQDEQLAGNAAGKSDVVKTNKDEIGGTKSGQGKKPENGKGKLTNLGHKALLDKKKDTSSDDDDLDSPKRSYGPFHFLTLFLVVGGVIVVAYVCMHNRKKLKEGVGNYMSGKSKRRRIRDYKPLSTAEK